MIKVPDGTLRILVQGVNRIGLDRQVQDDPYLVGEFVELPDELEETPEVEALTRNVQNLFAPRHRPRSLPARGAADRRRERRRSERALQSRRLDAAAEDRGEAAPARAARRRSAAARDLVDPQPRARGVRARLEDPVAGPGGDGEGPARVLPPPAAEGDPGRARRGRRGAGGDQRAARRSSRRWSCPRTCARRPTASSAGSRGSRRPRPSTASSARTSTGSLSLPWDKTTDDNLDLDQARSGARRGPLRPREGQGPDPRAPRGLEAEERPLRPDPLLRRPARRRQDLARTVDRARARPQVRPALRRRRARRGGDPRPPPHVHRRDARDDHPLRCATRSR